MKDSPHGVLAFGLLALGTSGLALGTSGLALGTSGLLSLGTSGLLPLFPILLFPPPLLLLLDLVDEELRKGAALVSILLGLSTEELPVRSISKTVLE